MLLTIDVGNTNTVLGVFDGPKLVEHWRIETTTRRTSDEHGILVCQLLAHARIEAARVNAIAVSSVVPPLQRVLRIMGRRYFGCEPLFVGPGIRTGMPVLYDNPAEVGADRIVNAVAAHARWPMPLVIVDFGTATTFDAVSARGEYLGGAICPGITISMEALFQSASKLPRVALNSCAQPCRLKYCGSKNSVRLREKESWQIRRFPPILQPTKSGHLPDV